MEIKNKPVYVIAECGIFIAMSVALSFLKIEVGALGGSIDFVMVPLFIICYRHGLKYGIASGMVYGILDCIIGGGIGYGLPSILLDYVLAFGACGVAGIFKNKFKFIELSVFIGCSARFIIHFISGITIYKILVPTTVKAVGMTFSNPVIYSVVYNMVYMLPNTVIAIVVMSLLRMPLLKIGKLQYAS